MANMEEFEKLKNELQALHVRLNNLNGGHSGAAVFNYDKNQVHLFPTPCAHYKYCSQYNTPACASCHVRQSIN